MKSNCSRNYEVKLIWSRFLGAQFKINALSAHLVSEGALATTKIVGPLIVLGNSSSSQSEESDVQGLMIGSCPKLSPKHDGLFLDANKCLFTLISKSTNNEKSEGYVKFILCSTPLIRQLCFF